MSKHILVISQYFYPEQFRINDICKEWVNKGYKVTVLTGIPNYPQGEYYKGYGLFKNRRENYEGIDIIRIPLVPRGNNSLMLSLNYLSFVLSGFFWKLFSKINADYVFIFEVSPMTQALPGVWYAKKNNIPCYIYVQDLWPENVEIVTGISNKFVINTLGKMVDYIYSNCDKIFTTSESFVNSIKQRGVSEEKVEFWAQYAEDFYQPLPKSNIKEIPDDDKLNIVFAGNIGEAQGLDVLPDAAKILKNGNEENIRFNIIGDGRYKETLIKIIAEKNVENYFNFIPRQPAKKIPKFMSANNIAFLSLSDDPLFEKTIPAKLQSYMACGMPIIASAGGEVEKIISDSDSGLVSVSGNAEKLAENIIELLNLSEKELNQLSSNSLKYYQENFDKEMLLNKMDKYFR
ncbi:glycosyltransferase family 4 protein [Halanaerobium saccharolyticum]|uniref:glycosyltransferase family 4 protein n=1 Tax=Halanaerobium saccharolyticum TaxID=43595 RepID=UPI003FCEE0AA